MGYSSLFFARIDYNDRMQRRSERSMEMMWNASDDYGKLLLVWNKIEIFAFFLKKTVIISLFSDFEG